MTPKSLSALILMTVMALMSAFSSYGLAQTVTPSFDCAKATTDVEKAICTNPELAMLDRKVADLYKQARDAADHKDETLKQQRDFVKKTRKQCVAGPELLNCLKTAYLHRADELEAALGGTGQEQKQAAAVAPALQLTDDAASNVSQDAATQAAPLALGLYQGPDQTVGMYFGEGGIGNFEGEVANAFEWKQKDDKLLLKIYAEEDFDNFESKLAQIISPTQIKSDGLIYTLTTPEELAAQAASDVANNPQAQQEQATPQRPVTDKCPVKIEIYTNERSKATLKTAAYIQATTDKVTIRNITVNRGNMDFLPVGNLPRELNFGEAFTILLPSRNVLEMAVDTDQGVWTLTFK